MPSIPIFAISNSPQSQLLDTVRRNKFLMTPQNGYDIPLEAKNIYITLKQATVVNFFYNISASLGNNIIYFTDSPSNDEKYTITIPDGSWDVPNLNSFIKTWLINNGFESDVFNLLEDTALQRVVVLLKSTLTPTITNYGVKFPLGGIANIVGFTLPHIIFNNTGSNRYYLANTTANFNAITGLIVECSLASSNIYNGLITNFLASVPIDVPSGSLLNYAPNNPLQVSAQNLAGQNINSMVFSVLDQNRNNIDIVENYFFICEISYDL